MIFEDENVTGPVFYSTSPQRILGAAYAENWALTASPTEPAGGAQLTHHERVMESKNTLKNPI